MRKIPSLFKRDYEGNRQVYDELVPGTEWVANGEGVATRKWDGTAVMFRDGVYYKRYDAKHGKTPPPGFEPAQEPDPDTGHWPGWLRVDDEDPNDKWFREGYSNMLRQMAEQLQVPTSQFRISDGTYELIGPKVSSGRELVPEHILIAHGTLQYLDAPRDFDGLRQFFEENLIEGLVWHRELANPETEMVKIKASDFGLRGWKNRRA